MTDARIRETGRWQRPYRQVRSRRRAAAPAPGRSGSRAIFGLFAMRRHAGPCATAAPTRAGSPAQVVEVLASPEFGGRSGAGGEKTVSYLIEQFRGLKLAPLFDGEYVQPIPGKEPGTVQGRNVGALLRGSDATLARRVGDRGGPFRPSGRARRQALPGRRRQCLGGRHDARSGSLDRPRRRLRPSEA